MRVDSPETTAAAIERVRAVLDRGDPRAAVAMTRELKGDPRWLMQVHALCFSEAGERLKDPALIAQAAKLWRAMAPERSAEVAYNLAVTEQALWDLAADADMVSALERSRGHVQEARRLYAAVGANEAADGEFRAKALTNLGNTQDNLGRDLDSRDRYEDALAIIPGFAMARGNRGVALLGVASFAGEHTASVAHEAAVDLDAALADASGLVEHGGPQALAAFRQHRARLQGPSSADPAELPTPQRLSDPHLEWCRWHGLLLHPSMRCVRDETDPMDPLFFRGLTVGVGDDAQAHMRTLLDAFGALKQDFVAARYTAWLADDAASPIREHAGEISRRVKFLDSLGYVRWGVRTGMGAQAFTSALNLLDKVAVFVQLYFGTGRVRLYFRDLWHPRTPKGKADQMVPAVADELRRGNRGLLALCDLSCELDQDTPLARLVELRNTATHRFLVSHDMLMDTRTPSSDWLQRVSHGDLLEATRELLGIGRAALVYLVRTIDIAEHRQRDRDGEATRARPEGASPGRLPQLELFRAETEHPDF